MKTTTLNQPPKSEPSIVKRPADARGQSELGWLHSRHTFSFGNYFDPDHMGFRSLRVINDDVVEAGQEQLVLQQAMSRGQVLEFGPERVAFSDVFREAAR